KTFRFEKEFCEYLGGDVECVAVNSATAGLHLALEAIGITHGDEVIVPDYTFTATAEVVRYLGADPVFVDVDYDSFNISVDAIEAAITDKTKAIMPVHFAGLACDMQAILDLANKHGLKVVEDAAHALPSSSGGVRVGQFESAASVFSFYANKTITTGEGGMLVTKDKAIADRARKMRLHGFDRAAFDRFKTGNWMYDIVAPGYKYNMTDIAASLGLHQLKKADFFQEERQKVCRQYDEALADLPLELPAHCAKGDVHSWHLYIVRVSEDAKIDRDTLFQEMAEAGITCSVHYTPLHRFTYWRETYDLKAEQFPQSERAGKNVISLPLYVGMEQEKTDYVIATLKRLLG
ncbi:MAG: DegT/DnrJ/EryC1/StrS family aminotransferase, partial [Nitratireductor sp.]